MGHVMWGREVMSDTLIVLFLCTHSHNKGIQNTCGKR